MKTENRQTMRTYPKHNAAKRAMQIPYDLQGRRDFLLRELEQYKDKTFYCKSLGVNVIVNTDSISETSYNAAVSRKATKIALYLPHVVRNGKIIKLHLPIESRSQTRNFHFVDIALLRCNVPKVGIAQIVVGYRRNGKVIEYAVTDYQVNKTAEG